MMTKLLRLWCVLTLLLSITVNAQTLSEKKSVSISITNYSPASTTLTWAHWSIASTNVYRKKMEDLNWTLLASSLTTTTFTDTTTAANQAYEYHIEVLSDSAPSIANGYIAYGYEVPAKQHRGNFLVIVDSRFSDALEDQLTELNQDLTSDGYTTHFVHVSNDSSLYFVKDKIDSVNSIASLEAVYLIGHVAVPYSGYIYPDGHGDHIGAWPTDQYYVTDKTLWTDNFFNSTNGSRPAQSNLLNDDKFDNTYLPEETFAVISRVDFYDITCAGKTETSMLQNYLDQASAYKRGLLTIEDKAIIDNNTQNYGSGFAANGHMNFPSLVDSIETGHFLNDLQTTNYKWGYACSFSSDTFMGSIGGATDFMNADYQTVFGMTFGSYFGDWNTTNNMMRSMMVDGKMLTNCWAGRPNWFFHHMGLNNPMGFSAKRSINNRGLRQQLNTVRYNDGGYGHNMVHAGILGDPSLRNNHLALVADFMGEEDSQTGDIMLSWTPVTNADSVLIYKADSNNAYSLLSAVSSTDSTFTDTNCIASNNYYIKYTSLQNTVSGSYYNNSVGSFITIIPVIMGGSGTSLPVELIEFTAVKVNETAQLEWTSAQEENFSHYEVQFSVDNQNWENIGSVQGMNLGYQIAQYSFNHFQMSEGLNYYRLKMIDFDNSFEYSITRVLEMDEKQIAIFPNPSNTPNIRINGLDLNRNRETNINVVDVSGNSIAFTKDLSNNTINLDARSGVYFITIDNKTQRFVLL